MLGGIRLRFSYTHERTCFAYINNKYSTNSDKSECVQVLCREKKVILWVIFSSNVPDRQIQCNPMYSKLLGLDEGLDVFVSPYPDVKILEELCIDTDSPEDQEILEHNAELLQLRILDQLRLVVSNQKAIVWISVSLPIIFTPKQTGILMNQSRIVVKVDAFNTYQNIHQNTSKDVPHETKSDLKFNNIGMINDGMLKSYLNIPKKAILRAIPIDSDGKRNLIHPYTVFIHEDFVEDKYKDSSVILATMQNIPLIIQDHKESIDDDNENNSVLNNLLCVEIVPIDHIVFRALSREIYNSNIPTVLIPKSLNNIINIENGMKIIFTIIGSDVEHPEHIHIEAYSDKIQNEDDIISRFKNCVIDNTHSGKRFLVNNGVLKQNTQIINGFLKLNLKPEKLKYTILNSESFRYCSISAKCLSETDLSIHKSAILSDIDSNTYCRNMKAKEELIRKVILHIYFEIHREACFKGASEVKSNVLVTGLSGSGKSILCQIVQKELTVWSHVLHCRSLKGRKDIPDVLGKAILMCQEHSPSVLICDDIDSLVPPSLEGASPQDIAYYQRLAVVIKHLLQSCSGVCVLMTALSMKALHPTLRQFSGKPMYTAHFDIPVLEQTDRVELLKFHLNEMVNKEFLIDNDDITKLAMDTAGHNVRDLTDYLNRKIFKAVKKKNTNGEDVKPHLVEQLASDSEKSDAFDVWSTVGGMDDVKQELTECIFWPLMYPALFPSQSCGILLYGPPGTGKSYIGSCLARLTNMNFLAVKGPELLSKYIGQSEKAVRDIFDKADMKRPCILFFDEFDSLAPKRGHDSTGVTDRVVNQLLSRLDGAEGGARGPVVVATSRPDLVDPALLRPGRLQRHVYCALPDQRGRHEVLLTLAKGVNVSEEVDLSELAAGTEGFSPADLKALLVTAQLTRLENQLDECESSMESVVVGSGDIETALAETKPSLSREQRLFYDMIYKRFRGESLSPIERLSQPSLKQKVTLA